MVTKVLPTTLTHTHTHTHTNHFTQNEQFLLIIRLASWSCIPPQKTWSGCSILFHQSSKLLKYPKILKVPTIISGNHRNPSPHDAGFFTQLFGAKIQHCFGLQNVGPAYPSQLQMKQIPPIQSPDEVTQQARNQKLLRCKSVSLSPSPDVKRYFPFLGQYRNTLNIQCIQTKSESYA